MSAVKLRRSGVSHRQKGGVASKTGVVSVKLEGSALNRGDNAFHGSVGRHILEQLDVDVVPLEIAQLNAAVEAAAEKSLRLDVVDDPVGARQARASTFEHGPRRLDEAIPGPGAAPLGLGVFEPGGGAPRKGAYLHFHGGGWVVGSAFGQSDARLQRMADETGLAVVSVDYRLAPEHRFPDPVDDAVAAFDWLARNSVERFGTDVLLAGGESSGAHLLVLAFLKSDLRRRYRALNLVYGFYDLELAPSARAFHRRLVFTGKELKWFALQLEPDMLRHADADVSPLRADFDGLALPPALFSVGTADALLDDTLLMAQKWASYGDAELLVFPGAAHGVGHFGPHEHTHQGADLNARIDAFLREHADGDPSA